MASPFGTATFVLIGAVPLASLHCGTDPSGDTEALDAAGTGGSTAGAGEGGHGFGGEGGRAPGGGPSAAGGAIGGGGDSAVPCVPGGSFEIRRTSTGYEIAVTDPPDRPCAFAALVCVLSIGDVCFGRHRYEGGSRVYPLTEEEFALLESGDPVSGYYGNPPPSDHTCAEPAIPGPDCPAFGFIE